MKILEIDGMTVQIIWKRNKHMYLRVKQDGSVSVTAPLRSSQAAIVSFVRKRRDWIMQQSAVHERQQSALSGLGEPERAYLKTVLPAMISHWEQALGVRVQAWQIRDMKTRWGSCTPATGRIRFALMLARVSEECIDYVVLHELVHLLEPSHNHRFQALMTTYMPDWRMRRSRMRHMSERD